jgi:acyl transferase domain-containing protein
MACIMPGAPDLETFWSNVVDGVDSVTEVPETRWVHGTHFDPTFDSSRRKPGDEPMSISKWGGFVPDVGFDALAWGIPPASLSAIDPAQLMALKAAGAALEDAGYGPSAAPDAFDHERASVIYATGSGGASDVPAGTLLRMLLRNHGVWAADLPPELDAFLPELTEDGLPGVLTSVIAGRVANRLDLGGKNLTVDSACASVLVALDIACSELLSESSDLVLCGGVDLHNGAQDYVSFTAAGALAPSGRCRSFDADADGMTLAEGVGCIVLKRRADAERDGDRTYAVIKGVAGSSDGRHLGLTAPRQEGQERAVRRAYALAGLSPADIGLVEAHGTGTSAGDRVELRTTTAVFHEAGADVGSIVLGSVKSNIGHTKCASAIASLIKAAKSAYHGVLPPTLHIKTPNEVWDPETSPFVFLDQARPWLDDRRLVGVSSFGFGGTNFHAIVENAAPAAAPGRPHWPTELLLFRAADDSALGARLAALATRLEESLTPPVQADRVRLRDLAAAVCSESLGDPVRLAIVASDLDDLLGRVRAAQAGTDASGVHRTGASASDVAAVLPTAADLRPGLAADLLIAFPDLRSLADAADADVIAALFPHQHFGDEERARQRAELDAVAPAALDLVRRVVTRALARCGVDPSQLADLPDDGKPAHGVTMVLNALAQLAVAGVEIDLDALHAGRDARPEGWTDPPDKPRWIVNGHYARAATGASLPKGLNPAYEAPQFHIAGGPPVPATAAPAPGAANGNGNGQAGGLTAEETAVVMEYLRIVQGVIATGSQIIRGHVEASQN